ncbi:MAG TPA: hypothetical protein VM120_27765 [Bryobacteraceae bacterium]|nr:hypothetical protein [Bryobacteraceae bacterium]
MEFKFNPATKHGVGRRLPIVIFAVTGEIVRVISLRKANTREQKQYENS